MGDFVGQSFGQPDLQSCMEDEAISSGGQIDGEGLLRHSVPRNDRLLPSPLVGEDQVEDPADGGGEVVVVGRAASDRRAARHIQLALSGSPSDSPTYPAAGLLPSPLTPYKGSGPFFALTSMLLDVV
jgi:hypothetical protein